MPSFIENLYTGNLQPLEMHRPEGEAYHTHSQHMSTYMNYFQSNLKPDDFKVLQEMLDTMGELHSAQATSVFVQGFKTGAHMMVEVFQDKTV
jgi:poly(3-hydroxybutyrate) depolymerase